MMAVSDGAVDKNHHSVAPTTQKVMVPHSAFLLLVILPFPFMIQTHISCGKDTLLHSPQLFKTKFIHSKCDII